MDKYRTYISASPAERPPLLSGLATVEWLNSANPDLVQQHYLNRSGVTAASGVRQQDIAERNLLFHPTLAFHIEAARAVVKPPIQSSSLKEGAAAVGVHLLELSAQAIGTYLAKGATHQETAPKSRRRFPRGAGWPVLKLLGQKSCS